MTRTQWDVIVVGAGIAGLSAATAVHWAGRTVRVLEARDRVGGRASSISVPGGLIDLGATWFWPNEPLVASFVDQFGIATFPQHLDGDALFEATQPGVQRLAGNPIDTAALRFTSGAQEFAQTLADRLPPAAMSLNDPVTRVTVTAEGVQVDSASGIIYAAQAIIAMPPALVAEQISFIPDLSPNLRSTAEQTMVWMGQMVKAVAVYEDSFWRTAALAGAAISYTGPFREFHDHSGPDATPGAIFGFATAGGFRSASNSEIVQAFRHQLTRTFGPQASQAREFHVTNWSREPFTVPQRSAAPTSTTSFGAAEFQQPVHGRLHWASTETASEYAGHIEGAVLAGLKAAEAAMETA